MPSNIVAQLVEDSIERLNVNALNANVTVVAAWTGNGLTIVFDVDGTEVTVGGDEWQKALDRLPMAVMSMLRMAEQNAADSPTPNIPVLFPVLTDDTKLSDDTVETLFGVWSFTWERLDGPSSDETSSRHGRATESVQTEDVAQDVDVTPEEPTSEDTIVDDTIVDDSEPEDDAASEDTTNDAGDLF